MEPRLAFGLQNRTISLGGKAAERFWLPDTFFVNAIDTKIHHMLFTNKKIWVNLTNGFVMLSARCMVFNFLCLTGWLLITSLSVNSEEVIA